MRRQRSWLRILVEAVLLSIVFAAIATVALIVMLTREFSGGK